MRQSILCRKCLVISMCNQKCQRIYDIVSFLSAIVVPFTFTYIIIGCVGLLMVLFIPEASKIRDPVGVFIIITEAISFLILTVVLRVEHTISERF